MTNYFHLVASSAAVALGLSSGAGDRVSSLPVKTMEQFVGRAVSFDQSNAGWAHLGGSPWVTDEKMDTVRDHRCSPPAAATHVCPA
jgi:hypothetical protein